MASNICEVIDYGAQMLGKILSNLFKRAITSGKTNKPISSARHLHFALVH